MVVPVSSAVFSWSDAIKLANKCNDFEEAFIEVITGLVAGRKHLTSNLQTRCWRRYLAMPDVACVVAPAMPQVVPPRSATPVAHGG
eukprot:10235838-Heterocapsa_arctica.AAC.1